MLSLFLICHLARIIRIISTDNCYQQKRGAFVVSLATLLPILGGRGKHTKAILDKRWKEQTTKKNLGKKTVFLVPPRSVSVRHERCFNDRSTMALVQSENHVT
jgi:hypothetical protein